MTPELVLKVNGVKYSGWKSIQLTRSMEQLAHSFQMGLTDKWADMGKRVPVAAGDSCWLVYGDAGTVVTNGWIDEDTLDYDAEQRGLGFSGRSLTGDLVDCAAVFKGGQWKKATLLQIATDICAPFAITVQAATDVGAPFPLFKLEPGEKCFQALERAARMRGVLMMTLGDGSLVFERTGQQKVTTVLEHGKNIKRGSFKRSWVDRFSTYVVFMQSSAGGAGGDGYFAKSLAMKRHSDDAHVSRYRPTIINAETEDDGSELQKRADWERNVRAGRSVRLTYTVQGWEHAAGLWEPNRLVRVIDPQIPIDDELLIVTTTQKRDEQGSTTELQLAQKDAFTVEPLPPKKQKKGALDYV